jgi:hypothetical protein
MNKKIVYAGLIVIGLIAIKFAVSFPAYQAEVKDWQNCLNQSGRVVFTSYPQQCGDLNSRISNPRQSWDFPGFIKNAHLPFRHVGSLY